MYTHSMFYLNLLLCVYISVLLEFVKRSSLVNILMFVRNASSDASCHKGHASEKCAR
jgi:hypothetical protein